uniref:Uncharacterized protein n=1 Tax=Myoviridae sp. ctNQV2 TaxID=2827683 RepID=A0A8S5RYS2_9CAUD|nr:MAG TPA: hypothetical protein [Myoviridae sp. ctNQV2]
MCSPYLFSLLIISKLLRKITIFNIFYSRISIKSCIFAA